MEANTAGLNRIKHKMNSRAFRVDSSATQKRVSVRKHDRDHLCHSSMNDAVKDRHRKLLIEFFKQHTKAYQVGKPNKRRVFTLPGREWKFEQRFHQSLSKKNKKHVFYIGAESQQQTMDYGVRYMPRVEKECYWETMEPVDGLKATYLTSETAAWCHLPIGTLMWLIARNAKFSKAFGKWDCFWWDLDGPLMSIDVAKMLTLLPRCLNKQRDVVPFAVTFKLGRDPLGADPSQRGLKGRVKALVKQMKQPRWLIHVEQKEQYQSVNGSQMAFVCGLIIREL